MLGHKNNRQSIGEAAVWNPAEQLTMQTEVVAVDASFLEKQSLFNKRCLKEASCD